MARKRAISVTGGSVQLQLSISNAEYHVDVWKSGDGWKWTAQREKAKKPFVTGGAAKWSDARTAAFRACLRESRNGEAR